MTDAELRQEIVAAGIDVARWANNPNASSFEIHFAAGTLQRFTHELRKRHANDSDPAASDADEMIPA